MTMHLIWVSKKWPSRMYVFNRPFHSILFLHLHWLSNRENGEACIMHALYLRMQRFFRYKENIFKYVHLWQIIQKWIICLTGRPLGQTLKIVTLFKPIISFCSSYVSISIILYLFINYFYYISIFAFIHFFLNHCLFKSYNLIFSPWIWCIYHRHVYIMFIGVSCSVSV